MSKTSFFIIIYMLCFTMAVFAGITGKISGRVVDAENGQPLPGANVIIEGTSFGAAANLDGYYVILNVPPGEYTLRFTMIGYVNYRVQNVRVIIDQTTTIPAKLKSEVLAGDEVVVIAERPVVTKDVSNSQMNVESKTIEAMPVQTVEQVLTLQAGIESGREGILVRGGTANQTVFMVDGFSMNDERNNIPYTSVSLSAIQEVQVQTGGFNAEYSNMRSALVNAITKEGDKSRYSGTAIVRYSPAAQKHFGPSVYDPYSYFNRPFMDPAVCYVGTMNGTWDEETRGEYPFFKGWNAVSNETMTDGDPSNDLTPEGAKRLYEWQHRRQGDIDKPDYVVDVGFGGPVPAIGEKLGNLRFYAAHISEQSQFVFPLSRDSYDNSTTQLKLVSDITPSIKLYINGTYGETYSTSPYDWTITPTGRVLRGVSEVADLTSSNTQNNVLYMPGYYSPTNIYHSMVGFKLTHVVSPMTFYDVRLEFKTSRYHTFQTALRDTSKIYEIVPGYFTDESPYGYWGEGMPEIYGRSNSGWMNLGRERSFTKTALFNFDMTSQVNRTNQIKLGLEVVYNDHNIDSGTENPSMGTWTRSMIYSVFPFRIGAYAQDKLEFEGFIANVGVRLDYTDANADKYLLETYDKYLKAGYGNLIESEVETRDAKAHWYLSPRLGVSHPISDNSKLYFNYGHFYSEPPSSYRFRLQRESNGMVTHIGNPDLEMEKTVAYELGLSQNLFDMYLLNIAGYYKDVSHQFRDTESMSTSSWILYENINGSVRYYQAANNNYQDVRGFEITLTKRAGNWLTGFINYTYDVSTTGYFGYRKYYEDPNKQREYVRDNPYISKPHPRPYARASVDIHTPEKFGPAWLKALYPLGGWNLNILADWKAGSYYTYDPFNRDVVDDTQWRDYYNIDLRLAKVFGIKGKEVQFYVDMTNALNTKRLSYSGFSDSYDFDDYMKSLCFSWEEGDDKGDDRIGDYRPDNVAYDPMEPNPNNDPVISKRNAKRKDKKSYIDMPNIKSLTFLNPRDITVGIKINF